MAPSAPGAIVRAVARRGSAVPRRTGALARTGACAASVALLAVGGTSFGSTALPARTGATTISLPATLDGYRDILDAIAAKPGSSKAVSAQRANQASVRSATIAAYARAFGGAAAVYRQYANPSLTRLPWVIAVRSAAPGLTIGPVPDLKYLELATPPREVLAVGPVSCEVDWTQITPAGRTPNPADEEAVQCERSGSGRTAYVGSGGFTGPSGITALATLASAAWTATGAG